MRPGPGAPAPWRPRILIVEDAPENVRFVGRILKPLAELNFALGGEDGLARARALRPDLILLDVEMPDMSGYEVIRVLKSRPETRDIPVIFLTGRGATSDEAGGLELGAIDYVTKPFHAGVVVARVRNQLQLADYARRLREANAELERRATTDPLTGLPNRRAFNDAGAREVERLRRFDEPCAVLMLDIDHFKRVNDTWGHDAGDAVLREVARRLEKAIRKTDFAGRLGGEEFALLMPKTDLQGAEVVAGRLLDRLRGAPIQAGETPIPITATLGVSLLRRNEDDPLGCALKRADLALYQGKGAGRNRVVLA